jgi:FMN phosphatase YigB (HAD superfamily)
MQASDAIVFLFDCDNTLLDNDRVQDDLRDLLLRDFGRPACDRYWQIFEELRARLGYADYLQALQQLRPEVDDDPRLLEVSAFLLDYPFAERLYSGALDMLERVRAYSVPAILSDGDVVFQPHKIRRAGLWNAVAGRVLIYVHKERQLADLQARLPARHYIMVDDKSHILADMKAAMGERLTTVSVRQGHYALQAEGAAAPAADMVLEHISDLRGLDRAALVEAARPR